MSDNSEETAVEPASAFMNADVLYESAPEEPTDAGESPEVEEEAETVEVEAESDAEPESDDEEQQEDSTRYRFDEESDTYVFKAAGKEVTANTDELIELASKGVGFEKKTAQAKRAEEQRAQEHTEALSTVKQRETELQTLIESLGDLIQEESLDESLLDDDPSEYIRQEKRIKDRQEKIQKAQKAVAEKRQQEIQEKANREWTALVEAKGWETNADAEKGFGEISKYMQEAGINQSEIYPHQFYLALEKAAKYDALQAKKDETVKEVKKAPKSVKSKKAPAKNPNQGKTADQILYGT